MSYRMLDRNEETYETARRVAQGLGWFSIALGVAELLAPRHITHALGMEEETRLVRAYGAREVASGVAILAQRDPAPAVWTRVVGDVLDLATLAVGLGGRNRRRTNVGVALGLVAAVTVVDVLAAKALQDSRPRRRAILPVPVRDYSDRSGLPFAPDRMRGAATRAWNRMSG